MKINDPLNYYILFVSLCLLLESENPPKKILSSIALERLVNYDYESPFFTLWMIILLQLDAINALKRLETIVSQSNKATKIMENICSFLNARTHRDYPQIKNPDYLSTDALEIFIPLTFQYINPKNDINRHQKRSFSYTPNNRDFAQEFRGSLLIVLSNASDPKALKILKALSNHSNFNHLRDYILHLIDINIEISIDPHSWQPKDIVEFMNKYEIIPKNEFDLFRITCNRIEDIKSEVEIGEISRRNEIRTTDQESKFRSWLALQLRTKSKGHYTVVQEEEIDMGEPDIRIEFPEINPTSIELKIAEKWSFQKLVDGLEGQLVGQYLNAPNNNCGLYVIAYVDKSKKMHWQRKYNFIQLVEKLQMIANKIVGDATKPMQLKIFGIDFTLPEK